MLENAGATEKGEVVSSPHVFSPRKALSREDELMGAGAIIIGASFLYPHVKGLLEAVTPGCLFHRLTGLPCLFCGMTRSFAATAGGRWEEAFRMHLLGPPLFVLVAALTALLLMEKALTRRLLPRPGKAFLKGAAWGFLVLLVMAWVLRLALFGVNV
ncbi:MAG: DUF2752 domain-containing protein [Actinobacteria bacterium]|nr:DUF2752 domain-containing protein [Actinomycetota bacterium]